jgi:hypothetical protein
VASREIEERFLDCPDRRLRRSEGGRNSRSDLLGMTVFSGGLKRALLQAHIFFQALFRVPELARIDEQVRY